MTAKKRKKSAKITKKSSIKVPKKVDLPIEIMGLTISGTQTNEVLKKIWLQRKEMLHVATVNPEFVMEARMNPRFRQALGKCLTVADGWGIVWASRILVNSEESAENTRVERVSGSWLSEQIVAHAAAKGEKIFLLGAAEGIGARAAAKLTKKYPQLQVAWYSGAQTVKLEKNEEANMTIAKINAYEPDYLLVAYGSPWQDIWVEDNRPYLRARVAMGVGGVLDEWAGVVQPCPDWLDRIGLKWLWRVATQPWRATRILRVFHFGLTVLFMRLKRVF